MKKQFIFIVEKKIEKNKKNFLQSVFDVKKTIPKKSSFIILDLSKFYYGKDFNLVNKLKKKFNFIKVNNEQELEDVLSNKKNYCFPRLKNDFKMIRILRLIKKFKIKIISSTTEGLYPQSYYKGKVSFSFKLLSLFKYKFNYFIFRILAATEMIPSVDYFFEASQNRINFIKKNRKKNLLYFLFGTKSFYYKNIIRVNSSINIVAKNYSNLVSEKYIVFVDSGYDHPDVVKKEIKISKQSRTEYYNQLFKFLVKFQDRLKIKVVFCKHPKGVYPNNFNKFYKYFDIKVGKTEFFIAKAKLVIFSVSTLLNLAILLNKNILIISSNKDYNLVRDKLNSIKKEIPLISLDISNDNKLDIKKIMKEAKNKKKLYKKFIKMNHIANLKKNYYEDVKEKLSLI